MTCFHAVLPVLGCRFLVQKMHSLKHGNGRPLVVVYGAHQVHMADLSEEFSAATLKHFGSVEASGAIGQGPVIAFNILRADGSFVGYK